MCDCRNCWFLSADAADFWAIPLPTFLAGSSPPAPGGQDNISDGNFPVRNPKKSHFHSPCFPPFAFLPPRKRSYCWLLIFLLKIFSKISSNHSDFLLSPLFKMREKRFQRLIWNMAIQGRASRLPPPRFNPGTFLAPGSRSSNIQIFSPFQQWTNIGKLQNSLKNLDFSQLWNLDFSPKHLTIMKLEEPSQTSVVCHIYFSAIFWTSYTWSFTLKTPNDTHFTPRELQGMPIFHRPTPDEYKSPPL